MKMTLVELRRNSQKLVKAVENREEIVLSRRGKPFARIIPVDAAEEAADLCKHPAVGMWAGREDLSDPAEYVRTLRKGRFSGL